MTVRSSSRSRTGALDEAMTASARLSAASVSTAAAVYMHTILGGHGAKQNRPASEPSMNWSLYTAEFDAHRIRCMRIADSDDWRLRKKASDPGRGGDGPDRSQAGRA